jgi:cell division protein FtsQ
MSTEETAVPEPKRKPQVRRLGIWFMIPLMAGMIALSILSWEWRDGLKFQHIVVDGARFLPVQQIFTLAAVPPASELYAIDLYAVRSRLLTQPFVKSAVLNRQYPGTLHVELVERVPIAAVNAGQLWYVDEEGTILPYLQAPVRLDLPVISGCGSLQALHPGERAGNQLLSEAIVLLQTAQAIDSSMYHFLSEVNMNDGKDIILYSTDVGVPIIFGRGDAAKKLVRLQAFWGEFVKTNNAARLRYVDLRFDDQVVVKWLNDDQQSGKTAL